MTAPMAVNARLRIAGHLAVPVGGSGAGTFVATGLVGDSGTMAAIERYQALAGGVELPAVVHGAESFAGAGGAIAIDYDGIFRPAAPGVFAGEGAWRVTGGDHAYERLVGGGSWTATAIVGREGLTVDVVYEGKGALG
jgi:hypothetical protein